MLELRKQNCSSTINATKARTICWGYALECAIKACIARQVKKHDFPDNNIANACYTHKLGDLLGVAGLKQKLLEKEKNDEDFK